MTIKTSTILPFNVKDNSEVTGGYANKLHTEFGQETEITNYHEDDYRITDKSELIYDAVIQGPFTQTWVGGRSHRHVPLNFGDDTAQTRPEAWHVQLLPNTIRLYSHSYLGSPPAYWTKEEFAKRPVSIKNIDNTEKLLGNFSENYQILQTSGRRITNNLIVDGFVASSSLTTQFVTGANNYSLPDLTVGTGSKSVIVERFNAPGGKEESSRGALDREGEEMSPNIPLPFRNIKIRQPFYRQLSQHMPQFGSGSTFALLPETGTVNTVSIHKVNRNRLVRAGNEQYDNWFVQHQIPRTDIQYSWITASALTTAEDLGGYQYLEYVGRQKVSSGIEFTSGSFVVSGSSQEYFVDNLFINSLIKDTKQINLETNTYSASGSLSASMSEYVNSPYTFTVWTSLRNGETPVARSLKKQNIYSIQDSPKPITHKLFGKRLMTVVPKRSQTSTNFKDPPVTFKYHPLEHELRFDENATAIFKIKHEYANVLSKFANKDLNKRLIAQENFLQFYDLLLEQIKNENVGISYLGHSYKEVVWPREENTGLKETRKRNEYYLNQPGFNRDGYDRQLGTQRAFWRDAQQDRKRSKNSEGGYYSSINYLSTEETGSNFAQNEIGVLSNNKNVLLQFNLEQNTEIDKGIFNSISLLESASVERDLLSYSGSATAVYTNTSLQTVQQIYGSINKKGYTFDVSGEFNNTFTDFYEQIVDEQAGTKKSIGTLYRNTSYKSLLNSLPQEREEYDDFACKTEDEEIFINPKVRYISFVGGAELNTGSFVQDENNFTKEYLNTIEGIPGTVYDMLVSGSDLYIAGGFKYIGDLEVNGVAKWNGSEWNDLNGGPANNAGIFGGRSLVLSGSEIYLAHLSDVYKWDGASWSTVGSGFDNTVNVLLLSGSDIYAGGEFTTTGSRIAKWDGATWSAVGTGLPSKVNDLLLSGSDIYAAIETLGSSVRKWDGASWSTVGSLTGSAVSSLVLSGSDIYAGDRSGTTWSSAVRKWDGANWNSIGSGFGTNISIFDMHVFNGSLYAGITGVSAGVFVWNGSEWVSLEQSSTFVASLETYNGQLYASGQSTNKARSILFWDELNWLELGTQPYYNTFSNQYFSQSFDSSSFSFSTLDNGLQRKTEQESGKKPFYDSYEEFIEDIRGEAKNYSVLPEFKISEHMQYYVSSQGKNFRAKNKKLFSLDGSRIYSSADSETSSFYDEEFIKTYSTTDILKKHDDIRKDNSDLAKLEKINLKISGIKKLLPYNGFYPQDRTIQLANLYSDYVDNNLHGGVYNLSYRNDYYVDVVIPDGLSTINSRFISVEKLNNKYYLATGIPKAGRADAEIYIYSSSADDPTSWSSSPVKTFTEPDLTSGFGVNAKIISASNGLNLFAYSDVTASTAQRPGYILHSTSSNGTDWSQVEPLQVSGSSVYISGSHTSQFGVFFDIIQDITASQEKIILAIGAPGQTLSDSGSVYYVTGNLNNNEWEWSDKNLIYTGANSDNNAGTGMSAISSSNGYQIFFGETYGDAPNTNQGNILVVTSSNGSSWSTPVIIASGSDSGSVGSGSLVSAPGLNDVKAVDFEQKTYLFFSEPYTDISGNVDNGGVYCITSSINNEWPASTSYLNKKILYYRNSPRDQILKNTMSYSIQAFSGSDGRLYYSFSNYFSNFGGLQSDPYQIFIGSVKNEQWQTIENNQAYLFEQTGSTSGGSMISVAGYEIEGYQLPIFFSRNSEGVLAIKNNIFTDFTLKVSGSEKYYKHAALEPFMAPGILYNTIKSGLAVDWPCATGSNTAIVPYGGDTIVNAYYPKSFEMASFSGSNIYESMYGQVRSNVDYRIPFENILFPNEAFIEKTYQEEDLISRTVLSTLDDEDPLVQFIDKTYIYGGYEPYISPIDFSDINNLGPKRFSVPFVYKKKGSTDTGLYTLAMSNFLAETVKFFLKDEKMITFSSQPDYKWKQFDSNKTYYMDVILEKTPELTMMEAYHSDLHPTGSSGEKMNGRYFGYPVNKTDKALWGGAAFTEEESKLIHNDPAYAPYTPPYFEGVAKVRISFKPSGTSRAYTVQEIFDEATIENIFDDVAKGATTGSDAYVNKMPVGSSFDVFGSAQATEVTIDEVTGQQTVRELTDTQNWIISPRLETPVLDFSSQTLESYENDYSKTSGFGRGMWSGYGSVPSEGKGIKVRLAYPYAQEQTSPLTASLLDQVGFKAEEKNIGQIADTKTISEAIVLVPYLEKEDSEYTIKNSTGFNFIKLSKNLLDDVKKGNTDSDSVSDMITKMEKYVIPPEMNFLQFSDIKPFVMYLFEFEHTLTQQDLADIWQGVMPSISETAEKDEITISHSSGEKELFEGKEMPDNLRWLVFKVKKKAEKNYFNITATTKDDERFNFNKIIGRETGTDVYSYNWPYDYFSLVEMAKVELKLDYKAKETE